MTARLPDSTTPIIVLDLRNGSELSLPLDAGVSTVLCIGNLDGVHLGHRRLIEQTVSIARSKDATAEKVKSGAWFFSTPTREGVSTITTVEEKLEIMRSLGLDIAFIAHFPSLRELSPYEFATDVLAGQCACCSVVCGYNFRYGKDGVGDASSLKENFPGEVTVVDCVMVDGIPVSSSAIREYISQGSVERAAKMLTRPYGVSAPVIQGKMLGRHLGFPTANQLLPETAPVPALGVYVSLVCVDGRRYIGVTNIGHRPTVEQTQNVNCETYILDFSSYIYDKVIRVELLAWLRPEIRFSSISELVRTIGENAEQAREYFRENGVRL